MREALCRILPLSVPDIEDQPLNASFDETTARCTSSLPDPLASHKTWPVEGSVTRIKPGPSSVHGSQRCPSMKLSFCWHGTQSAAVVDAKALTNRDAKTREALKLGTKHLERSILAFLRAGKYRTLTSKHNNPLLTASTLETNQLDWLCAFSHVDSPTTGSPTQR